MPMSRRRMGLGLLATSLFGVLLSQSALGQAPGAAGAPASPGAAGGPAPAPPDEAALGEFVVTGHVAEHVTKLVVLPSLSPDMEDVVVRSVVRRDLELSGMFEVIPDQKAPPGLYGFDDVVDVDAWKKLGAEVIVKAAARKTAEGKVEVYGLAYFLDVGKDPVFSKKILIDAKDVRVTSHRITDALLGAITGRPGGFASHFAFSGKWGRNRRIFTMDADGHALTPLTNEDDTAITPAWGPGSSLYYANSHEYRPFQLMVFDGSSHSAIPLPLKTSIYSIAFDGSRARMALAIADQSGSSIWVGKSDGSDLKKVSTTAVATHPAFSPSGKLAWIGGEPKTQGAQRVYIDGNPVSPMGFSAAAPAFCDTEDGVKLVYSVAVGGNRQDLVMSNESGQGMARLTQDQGSNTYPACSTDGRLLAFFSTRTSTGPGIYLLSLKRWITSKVSGQAGESLRWEPLPKAP